MYDHFVELDLADISQDETLEMDMLIGLDFYWQFVTGETIRGQSGPVAVGTTLGSVFPEPAEVTRQRRSIVNLLITHTLRVEGVTNKELDTILLLFWELLSLGIQTPNYDPMSDQFASFIKMKDGKFFYPGESILIHSLITMTSVTDSCTVSCGD